MNYRISRATYSSDIEIHHQNGKSLNNHTNSRIRRRRGLESIIHDLYWGVRDLVVQTKIFSLDWGNILFIATALNCDNAPQRSQYERGNILSRKINVLKNARHRENLVDLLRPGHIFQFSVKGIPRGKFRETAHQFSNVYRCALYYWGGIPKRTDKCAKENPRGFHRRLVRRFRNLRRRHSGAPS